MKTARVLSIVVPLVFALSASSTAAKEQLAKPAAAAPVKQKLAKAAPADTSPQVVEISVTKDGFVPAQVKVKVGRPVKLLVTRKIERTCATDIVIKDYGIKEALPLDKTVEVTFTPNKAGSSRFACAMDMIAGVIVAE